MASDERIKKLRSVLENRQIDLKVILEDIHDPHNVNAIYRSCEAVGVMDVILLYMKEEFPEIKFNSSGSACKWIDLHKFSNPNDVIPKLKEDGYQIYSLVLDENAKTIYDINWNASGLSSGLYFARLLSKDYEQVQLTYSHMPLYQGLSLQDWDEHFLLYRYQVRNTRCHRSQ